MESRKSEFHLGAQYQQFFSSSKSAIQTGWLKLPESRAIHFKDALHQSVLSLPDNRTGSTSYSYGVN